MEHVQESSQKKSWHAILFAILYFGGMIVLMVGSDWYNTYQKSEKATNEVRTFLEREAHIVRTADLEDFVITKDTMYFRVLWKDNAEYAEHVRIAQECGRFESRVNITTDVHVLSQVVRIVRRGDPDYESVRDQFQKRCFVRKN